MNTAELTELMVEKTRRLPEEFQQQALLDMDQLPARQAGAEEGRGWSRLSGEHLSRQYSPADAIYDQD